MSIAYEPLRPQPTDNVLTPTAVEQDDVEQDIVELVDAYQHRARHVSASKRVRRAPSSTGGPDTRHLLRADVLADTDVPVSALAHDVHRSFLERIFSKPFPGTFLAFDSSRCWLIYWTAQANALMGIQMDEHTKTRAISTLLHSQNGVAKRSAQSSVGGFGSGHGQISHLMGTYAAVMALAILGGPGPAPSDDDVAMGVSVSIGKGGWDAIDRPGLYQLLLSLKQPDGSFTVHHAGETDVRSIYCVLCVSLLLGIATPDLLDGVGAAIANCQTYEGGLSAASYPFASTEASTTGETSALGGGGGAALGEAHGGYVYCAMAAHLCLALLPSTRKPGQTPFYQDQERARSSSPDSSHASASLGWDRGGSASSKRLDLEEVVRWAASQQGIAVEGGGFRGRTNKLVDGCYGWFSGAGLGTVLGALTELKHGQWWKDAVADDSTTSNGATSDGKSDGWESIEEVPASDGYLFDRRALQEYILEVAQDHDAGGLRDKPGKRADAYHTCYNLSGLSLCQYRVTLDAAVRRDTWNAWRSAPLQGNGAAARDDTAASAPSAARPDMETWRRACYVAMLSWTIDPKQTVVLGAATNRVNITHPIFNVPFIHAKRTMDWAYGQNTPA